MIDDLFAIQKVPASWQALEADHIYSLVKHWKQRCINPVTIMRYMTIIRRFLPDMNCELNHIDNKSLQLVRTYKRKRSRTTVEATTWQSWVGKEALLPSLLRKTDPLMLKIVDPLNAQVML